MKNSAKYLNIFGEVSQESVQLEDNLRNFIKRNTKNYNCLNAKSCAAFIVNFKDYCINNGWSRLAIDKCFKHFHLNRPELIPFLFDSLEAMYVDIIDEWEGLDRMFKAQSKLKKEAIEYKGKLTYCLVDEYDSEIDDLDSEDVWYIYLRGNQNDMENIIKFKKPYTENVYDKTYLEHICRFIWAMETGNNYYKGNTCTKEWYDKTYSK